MVASWIALTVRSSWPPLPTSLLHLLQVHARTHARTHAHIHTYIHTFCLVLLYHCHTWSRGPLLGGNKELDHCSMVCVHQVCLSPHLCNAKPPLLRNHLLHTSHSTAPLCSSTGSALSAKHLCLFKSPGLLKPLPQCVHCTLCVDATSTGLCPLLKRVLALIVKVFFLLALRARWYLP